MGSELDEAACSVDERSNHVSEIRCFDWTHKRRLVKWSVAKESAAEASQRLAIRSWTYIDDFIPEICLRRKARLPNEQYLQETLSVIFLEIQYWLGSKGDSSIKTIQLFLRCARGTRVSRWFCTWTDLIGNDSPAGLGTPSSVEAPLAKMLIKWSWLRYNREHPFASPPWLPSNCLLDGLRAFWKSGQLSPRLRDRSSCSWLPGEYSAQRFHTLADSVFCFDEGTVRYIIPFDLLVVSE